MLSKYFADLAGGLGLVNACWSCDLVPRVALVHHPLDAARFSTIHESAAALSRKCGIKIPLLLQLISEPAQLSGRPSVSICCPGLLLPHPAARQVTTTAAVIELRRTAIASLLAGRSQRSWQRCSRQVPVRPMT